MSARTVGCAFARSMPGGSSWMVARCFGVVPKPLWTRQIPADERNRIPLAMRCLLVETGGEVVLVDTGLGNKEDDKFREIYGIRNAGLPTRLEDSLREAGVEPEDVDLVICTHLHFDHAGRNHHGVR